MPRRSNQGRGSAKKRGKTAGKGFVAPRATRTEKKQFTKDLSAVGSLLVPYGGIYKAAKAANVARKSKKVAKTFDEAVNQAMAIANSGRAKPTSAQVQQFMKDLKTKGVASMPKNNTRSNVVDMRTYKRKKKK